MRQGVSAKRAKQERTAYEEKMRAATLAEKQRADKAFDTANIQMEQVKSLESYPCSLTGADRFCVKFLRLDVERVTAERM